MERKYKKSYYVCPICSCNMEDMQIFKKCTKYFPINILLCKCGQKHFEEITLKEIKVKERKNGM